MISAYAVIALVFGLVLSYLGLIHRFWLRDVLREAHRSAVRWTLDFVFPKDLTQHVTLHGIDRGSRLLAYIRQHPMLPPAAASESPSAPRSSAHGKQTAVYEL